MTPHRTDVWLGRTKRYGLAVLLILSAVTVTRILDPYIAPHTSPPYVLAVMLASMFGGAGPGLLATVLAGLALAYFDLGLTGSLTLGPDDLVRLAVFTTVAVLISSISSARKRAESDLRAALDKLEVLDRAKDEFIAALSHELRTPLTSIFGWAAILRERELDPGLRNSAIQSIESSARTQAMIVDDLLDVSRMVLNKLELNREPMFLRPIVEEALDVVRPSAAAKSIRLDASFQSHPVATVDRHRLKQVVWNLLVNAVKFTDEHGQVSVELFTEGVEAVLKVTDSGSGIAPELLPHVFDRFRQGAGAAKKGGLGLGLSIARHIVELHGGGIVAASEGPGRGSTFTIRLPLAAAADRADGPRAVVG